MPLLCIDFGLEANDLLSELRPLVHLRGAACERSVYVRLQTRHGRGS
jgi:hypothetical protein